MNNAAKVKNITVRIRILLGLLRVFYSAVGILTKKSMRFRSSKLGLSSYGGFLRNPQVCRWHPYKKIHVLSLKQAWTQLMDFFAEGGGFEPPVRLPVRQFSKLLVSATHPSFPALCANIDSYCLKTLSFEKRLQRYCFFLD